MSGEVRRTRRALPIWPFHACPAPGRTRLASARSAGAARDAVARVPSARISSSPQCGQAMAHARSGGTLLPQPMQKGEKGDAARGAAAEAAGAAKPKVAVAVAVVMG